MKQIDKALKILHENPNLIKRCKGPLDKELIQKTDDSQGKSMLYDLIQLHSFKY